jgi:anaerobic selenocysteine-containing dehydrogenase
VPPEAEALRSPVNFRWFAEGRAKDVAEPQPLPAQWAEEFGKGLQTPSGKLEFIPENLKRHDPNNPDRPVLNRYVPSWEGPHTAGLAARYPLQMIATHSRYSFHTHVDGKKSVTNDIEDHRACIAGHYFYLLRMNDLDARERHIAHRDLIKIWNDRGAVICAADVSPMVARGVVKSFESSAEYQMIEVGGERVEIGGCLNTLTPSRPQSRGTSSMAPNSCMVQVERWQNAERFAAARLTAA